MRGHFHFCSAFPSHCILERMLSISFPCGILCGMLCFLDNEAALSPLFCTSLYSFPEVSDFLLALFFPFLLSALSLAAGFTTFPLIICFGKSFLYGFFCFGFCLTRTPLSGECFLLCLFSSVSLAFLCVFWRHYIGSRKAPQLLAMLSFFLLILAVGLLFYFCLLPASSELLFFRKDTGSLSYAGFTSCL